MVRAFEGAAQASRDLDRALNSVDGSGINDAARQMEIAGQNIEQVGRQGQRVGSTLTKAVTAPILGVGAAAIKTGGDFQASMSEVEAISGASASEMQTLEDVAREMGSQTVFSANESAEALNYMALAGFETEEMASALPPVLDLAAAGSMDLGQASDIVTKDYWSVAEKSAA